MLLILVMIMVSIPVNHVSAETKGSCGDSLVWRLDDAGNLVISGSGEMYDYTSAPWGTDIKTVQLPAGLTKIGREAFKRCEKISELVIPDGVIQIGQAAFLGCMNLNSITIPSSVKKIGNSVLSNCAGLKRIAVEEGNENYYPDSIYDAIVDRNGTLIAGCSNTVIPKYVTCIASGAFAGGDNLEIVIPESVTKLEPYSICYYTGKIRITMSSSVTDIHTDALKFNASVKDLYIIAPEGSVAQKYAREAGFNIVTSIKDIPDTPVPVMTTSPTTVPTVKPTVKPTIVPTVKPSANPTLVPTVIPTETPAAGATSQPGADATAKPSAQPSANPTPTANAGAKTVPEVKLSAPKSLSLGEKKKATVTTSSTGAQTWTSSNEKVLKVSADGTLNPVGCGSAEITVSVAETASCQAGTASVAVKVIPAKIKGLKVKAVGSGLLRVTWKKQKIKGASCEIQISTGKTFGIVQTAKPYPKLQKGKFLGRGLKRGQTIYVRMRVQQKDVTGKKVRGKWSAVKKVKVK